MAKPRLLTLRARTPSIPMTRLGQRICVVGTSGAGKTFVAEALARKLSLRYVCIDALIWRANWEPVSREEQLIAFNEATRESGWVCDGNLGASAEDRLLLERCDTIVWLGPAALAGALGDSMAHVRPRLDKRAPLAWQRRALAHDVLPRLDDLVVDQDLRAAPAGLRNAARRPRFRR